MELTTAISTDMIGQIVKDQTQEIMQNIVRLTKLEESYILKKIEKKLILSTNNPVFLEEKFSFCGIC